jgi:hypothetical protein
VTTIRTLSLPHISRWIIDANLNYSELMCRRRNVASDGHTFEGRSPKGSILLARGGSGSRLLHTREIWCGEHRHFPRRPGEVVGSRQPRSLLTARQPSLRNGARLGRCTGAQCMSYTLATAAAACGVNKSTILRAIKAGFQRSATSTANGRSSRRSYIGFTRRLQRRAPMRRGDTYQPMQRRSALADQRAALAEGRLVELKEMLADMQRDRNAWRDQAQRLALPKPEAAPMSWWRRLRTTG